MKSADFFDLSNQTYGHSFPEAVFDLLGDGLKTWIKEGLDRLEVGENPLVLSQKVSSEAVITGRVYIGEDVEIEPHTYIQGPTIILNNTQIRHGAYIRGNVWVGEGCVIGHTTEVKGSVFLDGAKAAHFAYVGDSVLGRNTNLGAGTKLANFKIAKNEVKFQDPVTKKVSGSGLRKFGSILADDAQTGCNSVLNPGSILMQGAVVLPCTSFLGSLEKNTRNSKSIANHSLK